MDVMLLQFIKHGALRMLEKWARKSPTKKVTINFSKFQLFFSNFDQIKRADALPYLWS